MPTDNRFHHQVYTSDPPLAPYELIQAKLPVVQKAAEVSNENSACADLQIASEFDSVYLIHGTFVGNDALGWTAQIEKLWPKVGEQLREFGKKMIDVLADETGNFTTSYANQLQQRIGSAKSDPPNLNPPVRLFNWSGENNHVARCVAAIELLDVLSQKFESENRILLFCHSHAGNVLALITNLLGGIEKDRTYFLDTIRPVFRTADQQSQWQRVSTWLNDRAQPISADAPPLELDIVTMGTPVRYGWQRKGFRNLLHFVHHCPHPDHPDHPEFLSPLPSIKAGEPLKIDGDFVQQFGIAGTNILPYVIDLPLMVAEYRMGKFLQPFGRKDFWEHLKIGMRVHHDGTTLLVHYIDDADPASTRRLAGHGVYTRSEWIDFHLLEVAKRFYEVRG